MLEALFVLSVLFIIPPFLLLNVYNDIRASRQNAQEVYGLANEIEKRAKRLFRTGDMSDFDGDFAFWLQKFVQKTRTSRGRMLTRLFVEVKVVGLDEKSQVAFLGDPDYRKRVLGDILHFTRDIEIGDFELGLRRLGSLYKLALSDGIMVDRSNSNNCPVHVRSTVTETLGTCAKLLNEDRVVEAREHLARGIQAILISYSSEEIDEGLIILQWAKVRIVSGITPTPIAWFFIDTLKNIEREFKYVSRFYERGNFLSVAEIICESYKIDIFQSRLEESRKGVSKVRNRVTQVLMELYYLFTSGLLGFSYDTVISFQSIWYKVARRDIPSSP